MRPSCVLIGMFYKTYIDDGMYSELVPANLRRHYRAEPLWPPGSQGAGVVRVKAGKDEIVDLCEAKTSTRS